MQGDGARLRLTVRLAGEYAGAGAVWVREELWGGMLVEEALQQGALGLGLVAMGVLLCEGRVLRIDQTLGEAAAGMQVGGVVQVCMGMKGGMPLCCFGFNRKLQPAQASTNQCTGLLGHVSTVGASDGSAGQRIAELEPLLDFDVSDCL